MATTKIWAIKDSVSRVVNYAKNPDKTTLFDIKQVLLYAENKEKTTDENETTMFVTGVNCNRDTAVEEKEFIVGKLEGEDAKKFKEFIEKIIKEEK